MAFDASDLFNHEGRTCTSCPVKYAVEEVPMVLLEGPRECGKTSLLLQYAFSQAKVGRKVIVLMYRDESATATRATCVPLRACKSCGTPSRSSDETKIWKSIQIKYLSTFSDLTRFVTSIQSLSTVPDLLCIDNYDRFCTHVSIDILLPMNAILYDTAQYLNQSSAITSIFVTAAMESSTSPLNYSRPNALSRWFKLRLKIEKKEQEKFEIVSNRGVNEDPFKTLESFHLLYTFNKADQIFQLV